MGERSWLTYCESINEWFDLWERIGSLSDASDELMAMGVDKAHEFIREHLDGQIPSMFELNYVLKITSSHAPFPKGSVVLAWSSSGDSTIQALPYYLRQQTEALGAFLAKYPDFNSEEGVQKYGVLYPEIRSPKRYTIVEDRLRDMPSKFFHFLEGLPEYFKTSYGYRTEKSFLDTLYHRFYDDPSMLAAAKRTFFCHTMLKISRSSEDWLMSSKNMASALGWMKLR